MRILYLSQYFPPEIGAPAARVSELAARWVARGHEVCVLTAFPHHPTGLVPSEYRGRLVARQWHGRVEVLRAFVYATPNRGVARRSLSYLSFAVSSVILGALARESRSCDVVIATSPQFLCAGSGYVLSRILRVPYVLEVRDLWPQSIVELGVMPEHHPVIGALRQMERFLYAQAAMLVGVTDAYARTWTAQGVPATKIRVVTNGVDTRAFSPGNEREGVRCELGLRGKFVVAYIGTHGLSHALDGLLEAAERLRDDADIRFLFVGEGAQRQALMASARARGLDNIVFLGGQPRDRIPEILDASDLVAVTLRKLDLFEQVIPSKIFEIMACARPILLAAAGESERVVRAAGCGYIAAPEDVNAMVNHIRAAKADPAGAEQRGQSGRAYVCQHYDRDRLADRYLGDLEQLVDSTQGSTG